MRNQSVANSPAGKLRAAHDQRNSPAIVCKIALHTWKRDPVVCCADDQRVFAIAISLDRLENLTDAFVHDPGARPIACKVAPGRRCIRDRSWQGRVVGLVFMRGLWILAMRFKESDIEKEGRGWPAIQEPYSRRRHMHCACILMRKYLVIPNRLGNLCHVLQSSQYRGIASRFECVHNVLLVVIQRKAAMGKSEHAAAVGIEPGEQG